jgi:hypothetical protein
MAEKKKKNFKDVTGIKFADLIMPALLGGIGSYSRPAGRGVELGLQAFRTFQAGQEFGDEREAKKKMSEYFTNQAQMAEDVRLGKQDPTEVSNTGFHQGGGPATPDPDRPVGEGEVSEVDPMAAQQFSLFGGGQPQGSDIGADLDAAIPVPDVAQALVQQKQQQEATMRDMGIADERKRFYEIAALTAATNPGAAGHMGLQESAQRMSHLDKLDRYRHLSDLQADNTKERLQLEAESIQAKHMNKKEIMALTKKYEQRYIGYLGPGGTTLTFDKDKGTWFADRIEITRDDWSQYDPMELLDMMKKVQNEYAGLRKSVAEGFMSESDPIYQNAKAAFMSFGKNVNPIIYQMGGDPISPNDIDNQIPLTTPEDKTKLPPWMKKFIIGG